MNRSQDLIGRSSLYSIIILTVLLLIDFSLDVLSNDVSFRHYIRLAFLDISMISAWICCRYGLSGVAKFIWLACLYLAFLVYPITGMTPNIAEDLFLVIFIFVIITSMILVFYDLQQEKLKISIWLIISTITFFYSFYYSLYAIEDERYISIKYTFEGQSDLYFVYIGACIFLLLVIGTVKGTNQRNLSSLQLRSQELHEQKKISQDQKSALEKRRFELLTLQNELSSAKDSLEKRVVQRKKELNEARKKLLKHGFINEQLDNAVYKLSDAISNNKDLENKSSLDLLTRQLSNVDEIIKQIGTNLASVERKVK